jgi:hypothetical protein
MTSICPAKPTARISRRTASVASRPPYLPQDRGATGAATPRVVGQHAIAAQRVRHVGEAVAYVVAETLARARARDAARGMRTVSCDFIFRTVHSLSGPRSLNIR